MLPKILRMRLEAVERVSAWGAMVAMCVFASPRGCWSPEIVVHARQETQKAASLPVENRSFSVLKTPPDQCVERAARRRVLFRYEWGVSGI